MKCLSCDVILSDFEATRKSEVTNEFFDLCNHCFSYIEEDLGYLNNEQEEENEYETD